LAVNWKVRFQCYKSVLFSSSLPTLQTDTDKVENVQTRFGSPRPDRFLTLRHPCLGRDPYFGSHCSITTKNLMYIFWVWNYFTDPCKYLLFLHNNVNQEKVKQVVKFPCQTIKSFLLDILWILMFKSRLLNIGNNLIMQKWNPSCQYMFVDLSANFCAFALLFLLWALASYYSFAWNG